MVMSRLLLPLKGTGGIWLLWLFAGVLISIALAICASQQNIVPSPVSETDASTPPLFSEERSFEHLNQLASHPRPTRSSALTQAATYVETTLRSYGWTVSRPRGGTVDNVIGRFNGNGGSGVGVAVSAHMDSVSGGPGATDDCVGVAVMLEIARLLPLSEPLYHDVYLLFVDGEESNLRGSTYFLKTHPWAKEIAAVVNLEGSGAAIRESLTRANSRLMTTSYAQSVPHPHGHALAEFLYATMKIGYTDLDMYHLYGMHGMDLIFTDQRYVYHTAEDDIDHVYSGAQQHEGDNVWAIVQCLANNAGLTKREDVDVSSIQWSSTPEIYSEAVYYDIPGQKFIELSTVAQYGISSMVIVLGSALLIGQKWIPFKSPSLTFRSRDPVFRCFVFIVLSFLSSIIFAVALDFAAVEPSFSTSESGGVYETSEKWQKHNMARIILYIFTAAFGGFLPLIQLIRMDSRVKIAIPTTTESSRPGSDENRLERSMFWAVMIWLLLGLLVTTAALPQMAYAPMWTVVFAVVAYLIEIGLTAVLKRYETDSWIDRLYLIRYCITIMVPLIFILGPWIFLIADVCYFMDALKRSYATAALIAIACHSSLLMSLPLLLRRSATSSITSRDDLTQSLLPSAPQTNSIPSSEAVQRNPLKTVYKVVCLFLFFFVVLMVIVCRVLS
eukprot:GILK01004713.1.p1 GENE.GILK01004713.1~~GILK01004713.1.p1  ORF type:complete len:670 (+),score=94.52 GILK01004713.1:143-2152(+)